MQHFNIVLALARSAMATKNPASKNHIARLVAVLHNEGEPTQARALAKLLDDVDAPILNGELQHNSLQA
jgi:hypothetical protein